VISGLKLSDITGESVVKQIRKDYPHLPIIVITDVHDKKTEIRLYESNIHNYISTPIDIDLTMAKIMAELSHVDKDNSIAKDVFKVEDLVVNNNDPLVTRGGKQIKLTAREFELLKYLLINKNQIVSRDKILNAVWGYNTGVDTRVVDVHIGNLRKKIDSNFEPKLITSVRGFGYKLTAH
jgi:DNA-binding response OmpR family regulator